MTVQEAIKAAREFTEAFSAGDWQRFRNSMGPNVVYEEIPTGQRIEGPDAVLELGRAWKKAGPDCKGEITLAEAVGNRVFIEVTWRATHSGVLETPYGTVPPSGKTWNVPGMQVVRVENNKITAMRQYFDMMTLLRQVGAVTRIGEVGRASGAAR